PSQEVPRSFARPMSATAGKSNHAALSPQTSQRYILATKLPNFIWRGLLWERQQKSYIANAVLTRCHNPYKVANLEQYPTR
ncbi:DUF1752-domain-containing protein, partial [Colletotrichum sublineola]